ncbi:MAG TPA: hypothetical protein VI933_00680 [archaeon]|nr:hypothetical protein [archaeon]
MNGKNKVKEKKHASIPASVIKQIKDHNFNKELKDSEYETKFNVTSKGSIMNLLEKIETLFSKNRNFLLCKVKGGDKLLTKVTFFENSGIEYSFFRYRGARMIKVKIHRIISTRPIPIFGNDEQLLIDKKDFLGKLQYARHRFKRHKYTLINLEKVLEKLKSDKKTKVVGEMLKTRVKDFVLNSNDGRIYAVAVTFCKSKNRIQKQLEIEYAGFIPGFREFKNNSREQIVSGVLGLSNYFHKSLPKILKPSTERKFEFVKKLYGSR